MKGYEKTISVRKLCLEYFSKLFLIILCFIIFCVLFCCSNLYIKFDAYKDSFIPLQNKSNILNLENQIALLKDEIKASNKARTNIFYLIEPIDLGENESIIDFNDIIKTTLNRDKIRYLLNLTSISGFELVLHSQVNGRSEILVNVFLTFGNNLQQDTYAPLIEDYIYSELTKLALILDQNIENIPIDLEEVQSKQEKLDALNFELKANPQVVSDPTLKKEIRQKFFKEGLSYKKLIIQSLFCGIVGDLVLFLLVFLKDFFKPSFNDPNFVTDYLEIPILVEIETHPFKTNIITKLFRRRSLYTNEGAYQILKLYSETKTYTWLSILKKDETESFMKATNTELLDCTGKFSKVLQEISNRNNFILVVDADNSNTNQILEVFKYIKSMDKTIFGAVVFTY